jgi:hypothetical protein
MHSKSFSRRSILQASEMALSAAAMFGLPAVPALAAAPAKDGPLLGVATLQEKPERFDAFLAVLAA